mmetsp:Transcript_12989/g.39979  ORF Transcript_12989/g.39979 Transcript_12989/m.39979 type:complete len:472 (+) Transcript_12989:322-1737(+)|eukprot:CAMPEP_0198724398 /NCGR_PEP_ID=MMETSP1475-20131203/1878_1 /TAXON_ID= ORGANISM="Unidentified sp., Strain CCMP1999" /NCGR_SAMPLE_ID=MMETSP1475 /ASSEMBLY_ACC=CAM_ASM_001111 /LENGTH=471 /DNA_ID=CAMNT_0044485925 /DNA_START=255 /DNA_END=1670 /DNA_ORIENTATION=-
MADTQPVDVETTERQFKVPVDEKHKSKVLKPWRLDRPHHRAFFFAWSSFFMAFFGWFSLSPLLVNIGEESPEIGIGEKKPRVTSNIVAVAGTILMRFIIGPLADRFGPRLAQSSLLCIFSIPVYLVGTARSYGAFVAARFFIGFLGATFVVTQYWTSIMFARNVVGTANATSAGWGNLGGGVTNALMPQFVKLVQLGGLEYARAWRIAMVIPASMTLLIGLGLFFLSDDCPDGNYRYLIQSGQKKATNPWLAFGKAAINPRSWILFALYAGCFGVELVMNGNLAAYFREPQFGLQDREGTAGLIAALFGLMNLFARSIGGIASDIGSAKFGMKGRLIVFFMTELLEGVMLLIFSRMTSLGGAIPMLILFSIFVQMAEGATFGVVPFVDPPITGAISGIVGAGGNAGAVLLNLLFRNLETNTALMYLSFVVMGVSFLVLPLIYPLTVSESVPEMPAKMIVDEDGEEGEQVVA